jgi:hypothetical protein
LGAGPIPDADRQAAAALHKRRRKIIGAAHARHLAQRHLLVLDARQVSRARGAVRTARRTHHITDRQAELVEAVLADRNLVLGKLAPDGHHLRHTRHREQLVPQLELGEAPELEWRGLSAWGGQRKQHDLAGDARDRHDLRMHVLRKLCAHGGEALRHKLARAIEVHVPVELCPHHREACRACRTNAARARQPIDRGLDRERHVGLDLIGGEPGRLGHDDDGWGVELREHVHRHVPDAQSREEQHDPCGHDDRGGMAD